jgi:hypothetical protein
VTEDEVLAALAAHGVDAPPFQLRMKPYDGQEHPGERVFWFPVLLADGRYLGVSWSFGQPDPDPELDWKPVWHAVHGPVTQSELEAIARGGPA